MRMEHTRLLAAECQPGINRRGLEGFEFGDTSVLHGVSFVKARLTLHVLQYTSDETWEVRVSESTFTLRVDASLKEAFTEIAKMQDRSGAQLIREFMRDVVQKAHSQEAYEQWFARKVAEGRADARLGHVVDNGTVMAQAAERRQRLLARLGEGQ